MWLMGDEDCGVSLMCRLCDTGGKPFAYYEGISPNPYPDISTVGSVQELAYMERRHLREAHGWPAMTGS